MSGIRRELENTRFNFLSKFCTLDYTHAHTHTDTRVFSGWQQKEGWRWRKTKWVWLLVRIISIISMVMMMVWIFEMIWKTKHSAFIVFPTSIYHKLDYGIYWSFLSVWPSAVAVWISAALCNFVGRDWKRCKSVDHHLCGGTPKRFLLLGFGCFLIKRTKHFYDVMGKKNYAVLVFLFWSRQWL